MQYRGKYAGEVRLEMTYYDTRPEDEAVIERRTPAAFSAGERIHSSSVPELLLLATQCLLHAARKDAKHRHWLLIKKGEGEYPPKAFLVVADKEIITKISKMLVVVEVEQGKALEVEVVVEK